MNLFSSLPRTLLALSLFGLTALPVLAVTVSLPPTSSNDPFRAIVVVYRTQQPEPPLCCLKPLPTINPPEGPEDVLLSFAEWKSKQLHAGSQNVPARLIPETANSDTPSKTKNSDAPPVDTQLPPELSYSTSEDALPPHFRVPIVDRFDYANTDCSARVHTTHKSAKSASSILSSKRDKYMLSPCSTDAQFVVVELCDDIRIDTVQLANFEFFSGVFKDFSVSVAKTYTGTDEGWTPAGTYRAKNIRGVQVRFYQFPSCAWFDGQIVFPYTDVVARLLPLYSNRLSFALWARILLPRLSASGIRTHSSRGMEVGHVASREPCTNKRFCFATVLDRGTLYGEQYESRSGIQ